MGTLIVILVIVIVVLAIFWAISLKQIIKAYRQLNKSIDVWRTQVDNWMDCYHTWTSNVFKVRVKEVINKDYCLVFNIDTGIEWKVLKKTLYPLWLELWK